jgi:AcrR family transcriptional regulator
MARKYQNTSLRKIQIVDAAKRIIIRQGSEHLTIRRMAKEVGITEGAIYRHFKSKKDILSFLVEHAEESLVGTVRRALLEAHPSLANLRSVLRSHISTIEQRRGISFQVTAEIISLGDRKLIRQIAEVLEKYLRSLRELLAAGIQSGEVKKGFNLDDAAVSLFGIIQGLVNLWALSGYNFDLEKRFDRLWMLFLQTVSPSQSDGNSIGPQSFR